MDPRQNSAERLPELYRAILDAVVELERRGLRVEAARARHTASRAYRVWDERAERRLLRLQAEVARLLVGSGRGNRGGIWPSRFRGTRIARSGSTSSDALAERAPSA
jgi:hypothetical protein